MSYDHIFERHNDYGNVRRELLTMQAGDTIKGTLFVGRQNKPASSATDTQTEAYRQLVYSNMSRYGGKFRTRVVDEEIFIKCITPMDNAPEQRAKPT
jgi:hypothetical protein